MKPYAFQQESIDKLSGVPHGLLADDMGLGKTAQAVWIDAAKRRGIFGLGLTLVIAPLSALPVWRKHFEKLSDLRVVVIDRKDRPAFIDAVQGRTADVYICHWDALRLIPELAKVKWFHVIADEAHRAKNRKAQQTMALKKLSAKNKLALSGTPADNAPQDLWSILNWLYPRTWSSYWRFFNRHVISRSHTIGNCAVPDCFVTHRSAFREMMGCAEVEDLHREMSSFYVRRLKEDVLDLPDKYWTDYEVTLGAQQRRVYEDMRRHMIAWIGEHEDEPVAVGVVIAQLIRLQQFAIAFAKFTTVMKRYREDDGKWARNEDGSFKLRPVQTVVLTDPSAKLDVVMEIIKDNEEKQFVVFGASKQAINLLATRLQAAKVSYGVLTGDTKQADRDRYVEEFQAGKRRVFLGTIAAGGESITLTAASTIIFIDRVWSPSKNRQAEDRLYRIGQQNAVQVIDIMAKDTVDLGRHQAIARKWNLIKQIVGDK